MCRAAFDDTTDFMTLANYFNYSLSVRIVLDNEKDLLVVCKETVSVVQWFTLGLYLKIAPYELERISVDCSSNRERLQQMLSVWLKTGAATWLSLVCALKEIGQSDLANEIAKKKGVDMFVCACLHE